MELQTNSHNMVNRYRWNNSFFKLPGKSLKKLFVFYFQAAASSLSESQHDHQVEQSQDVIKLYYLMHVFKTALIFRVSTGSSNPFQAPLELTTQSSLKFQRPSLIAADKLKEVGNNSCPDLILFFCHFVVKSGFLQSLK